MALDSVELTGHSGAEPTGFHRPVRHEDIWRIGRYAKLKKEDLLVTSQSLYTREFSKYYGPWVCMARTLESLLDKGTTSANQLNQPADDTSRGVTVHAEGRLIMLSGLRLC